MVRVVSPFFGMSRNANDQSYIKMVLKKCSFFHTAGNLEIKFCQSQYLHYQPDEYVSISITCPTISLGVFLATSGDTKEKLRAYRGL